MLNRIRYVVGAVANRVDKGARETPSARHDLLVFVFQARHESIEVLLFRFVALRTRNKNVFAGSTERKMIEHDILLGKSEGM